MIRAGHSRMAADGARGAADPAGGGDPAHGHRCPGEDVTVAVLATLAKQLADLDYDVPAQDLSIPLSRIPTRPRSGFVLTVARPSHDETSHN